jgi:hypothetical protein
MMEGVRVWVGAFPGLRSETWGTHFRAGLGVAGFAFVLSHPGGKDKDAARVGHPAFLLFEQCTVLESVSLFFEHVR